MKFSDGSHDGHSASAPSVVLWAESGDRKMEREIHVILELMVLLYIQ